jgi:hypothetical protein
MGRRTNNLPKDGQTKTNACCTWSSSDDATLVCVLHKQKEVYGNQASAEWKPQVWHLVANTLKAEGTKGPEKVWNKYSDHYTNVCYPLFSQTSFSDYL